MQNNKKLGGNKEDKSDRIIHIEHEELNRHLDKIVRGTVEETLNALLDGEADQLCQATRYQRSADRKDTRAGHYKRKLDTKAGQVELKIPRKSCEKRDAVRLLSCEDHRDCMHYPDLQCIND
jgi:putative transposase